MFLKCRMKCAKINIEQMFDEVFGSVHFDTGRKEVKEEQGVDEQE